MAAARIISWSEQLETGLPSVDIQHRRLIDIINSLGCLRAQQAKAEKLLPLFIELFDYTVYHFQHEADLMHSLPVNQNRRAMHLKAHQGFIDLIVRAREMMATNPDDVVDHLLAFLVKWLVHHISRVDMRMAKEIIALRSGASSDQITQEESTFHDSLDETVSELYDSIGTRTFEMIELNRQLQVYHDKQEEENALAQDIVSRLIQRGGWSSPRLHYWLSPTATFSGDIIAAVPSPEGRLCALIADATGHGLAAAITVLPVLSVFHAMVQRNRAATEILVEINRQLRATLPSDRFVAATLLCVDYSNNTAEAWNGGMPDLLLLGPDGNLANKLSSSQLPLGILDFDANNFITTRIPWEEGSQFVMYTDGLIEAFNQAEEQFGVERLHTALSCASADQRLQAVQKAITSHVGSVLPHDDIALMLIDCIND